MNAERLLAHYEQITDALDAIPRLRRFVLDLATRGKITNYAMKEDEVTTLGRIAEFVMGQAPPGNSYNERGEGTVFVKVGEFGERFPEHRAWTTRPLKFARQGDVLICVVGATIGKLNLGIDCAIGRSVAAIRPNDDVDQVFLFYSLMPFTMRLREDARGTAQGVISRPDLNKIAIWLPPLAEQRRIVANVDELMALCDRLEAARSEREATRDRLTAASLARLNAPDPDTFGDDARFALDSLPALTARFDQIKQLRQTILSLAVVGKLTENAAAGPTAGDELSAVVVKKLELRLRNPKAIAPIFVDQHWCELPRRWEWARWDQITDWITYGFTRPMPHANDGIPIVTGKNVNNGKIIFETAHRTPITSYKELSEKDRPQRGDILVTKDGSIGRTAIVENEEPFCINQSVAVLWLRCCHFDRRFLQLALDCPQTQRALLAKTEGVAIKHVSIVDLGKMVFPLPPLAEQHHIVARVDELMALCDQLEASLATADETRRRLLEALLAEALAPAAERELAAAE